MPPQPALLLLLLSSVHSVLLLDPFTLPLDAAHIPTPSTPFDSTSLGTHFLFTAPSGRVITILPFYTQDFTRTQDAAGAEVLVNASAPYFAARLAPQELGEYTYIQVYTATQPPPAPPLRGAFTVAGGPARAGDGFVGVQGTRFTLDSRSFFLVGENMAWPGCWPYEPGSAAFDNATGASYMYDRYLPKLAAVGGNWIRLWVGPSLVRDVAYDGEAGSFLALALAGKRPWGELNLEAAWRIEHVVELARSLGIKISLVMESQQCFGAGGSWGFWDACVFNAANGGPLAQGESPFTNPTAMAHLRARWQYIVARWGYSTSIFSWELQNESDDAQWPGGYDAAALAAGLNFTALLRAADSYGHLIDNSFGGVAPLTGPIHAWEALSTTAFTSVHAYSMADVAATVWGSVTRHAEALGKPCFLEEFGADWRGPHQHSLDPRGVGMHTGAWASLVGGAAGTAMQWFWAETDSLNTYGRLAGAAAAARRLQAALLAARWATWSGHCNSSQVLAGWTVGTSGQGANGTLTGVLAYVYNVNYTQGGCGRGQCVLAIDDTVALTLTGLPPPPPGASLLVHFFNTSTGEDLVLPPPPAFSAGAGEVTLVLPGFVQDCALWAEWLPPAPPAAPPPAALQFAGYSWSVKQGQGLGPGPNDWSAGGAEVDGAGRLHLRVAQGAAGAWECAEVTLSKSLGYGAYEWRLAAAPVGFDRNVVLGLFTYENDTRELDVEFSQWGGAFPGANADFAVQPRAVRRFEVAGGGGLTAGFTWLPGGVNFTCGSEVWGYVGGDNPPPGGERVHMNLWLDRGMPPASGMGAEVVVTGFQFTPML